ncbi:MAG: hypothetical protein KAR42_16570 [candidate division Zixibacteria bacterium]|nr:hypothetical protein [candidate division Zixibacteria bacterium]
MKKKVDLLGFGIAPVDFFVSMDKHPSAGLKIDGVPGSALVAGGGPVPTACCTFAKFGRCASLIAPLGDDRWGKFALEELDSFGVEHPHCIIRKNCRTALAFAWIEIKTGDRTIVLDMDKKLFIRPGDIKTNLLPIPKLIHLDGRHVDACIKLAKWGQSVGAKIMLDVGSVRNRVDDLFPHIDFLICADQFAYHHWKTKSLKKAVREFKRLGIPEVIVTSGIKGSFGIDAEGVTNFQKAYKVPVVDVTGAGDVYHGSHLFGIFKGWDIARRMKFAAAAAALKCKKPGARMGIPSYRKAVSFMNSHGKFYA